MAVRDDDRLRVSRTMDYSMGDDLDRRLFKRVRVGGGEEGEE